MIENKCITFSKRFWAGWIDDSNSALLGIKTAPVGCIGFVSTGPRLDIKREK
jgi:hypothetical protein